MVGDMKLRNFAETTIHTYTRVVRDFCCFHRARRSSRKTNQSRTSVFSDEPSKKKSDLRWQTVAGNSACWIGRGMANSLAAEANG
jgi:hypothetical protein